MNTWLEYTCADIKIFITIRHSNTLASFPGLARVRRLQYEIREFRTAGDEHAPGLGTRLVIHTV